MTPATRAAGLLLLALALTGAAAGPGSAQSVGYVTGFPGRDPAGDDEFGWGPAYRPETTFAQPGTPPTPGQIAGEAYRARTGRSVYGDVQGFEPREQVSGRGGYGVSAVHQRRSAYRRHPVRRGRAALVRRTVDR